MTANPHNIYIHVPFCMSKCNYCAFFSRACATPDWDAYSDEIITEIKYWGARLSHPDVPTIFFGGGTPSLMPAQILGRIMDAIGTEFNLGKTCEITLESNPGTIDKNKLNEFIAIGINRLSVGVQSLADDKLQFLGRRHSAADARRLITDAMARGIRVSGDFIYGLPGEGVRDIIETCNAINDMGLNHCSMYELTIEPGTPLARQNPVMPANDEMAEMYIAISESLRLPRYEVSNYARGGDECRHNQNVWDGAPYVGIGRGAAGRVFMDNQWYEQTGGDGGECVPISEEVRATEKIITGMRTMRGVKITDDVKKVLNHEWIATHTDLVTQTADGRIAATARGILILDEILINLVK